MLGSDRSRGYCLEMICADFLAGANLDNGGPEMLLDSMTRFFKFLPGEQGSHFLEALSEKVFISLLNQPRCGHSTTLHRRCDSSSAIEPNVARVGHTFVQDLDEITLVMKITDSSAPADL
jgi:hypothetical protein